MISSPLVVGYYFQGSGDPLTHLGIVREILMSNNNNVASYFYPAIHIISVYIALLSNLAPNISSYMVLYGFVLLYILFMYLCGRLLSDDRFLLSILFFSTCLLLPVNNISSCLMFYPTIAIVFTIPAIYFLIFTILQCAEQNLKIIYVLILIIFSYFFVLIHPLFAVIISSSLFVPSILMLLVTSQKTININTTNRNIFIKYTILFFTCSFSWIIYFSNLALMYKSHATSLAHALFHQIFDTLTQYNAVSESADVIGISIFDLIIKEFLISWIYVVFTFLAIFYLLINKNCRSSNKDLLRTIMLPASLLILIVFVFYVISGDIRFSFRYYGQLMIPVTIFGAIGLFNFLKKYRKSSPMVIIFFLVCYPVTYATIYPSPYINDSSDLITISMVQGAYTFFEKKYQSVHISSFILRAYRFSDVVYGPSGRIKKGIYFLTGSEDQTNKYIISDHFAERKLIEQYNKNKLIDTFLYIMLTETDVELNRLLNYYKFSLDDFIWFENCTNISKIYSNPCISFYIVNTDH